MKKQIAFILTLIMCMSFGITAMAAELPNDMAKTEQQTSIASEADTRDVQLVYQHRIAEIRTYDYDAYFSVPPKGLFNTRTVYLSGGARFADGVVRNIIVTVGNQRFNISADGSTVLRGEISVRTDMPVMISVDGLDAVGQQCILVFDVYTLE